MPVFYARTANKAGAWETAQHHLQRTGELCQEFLEPIGYPNRGEMMGRLHDFGKLSPTFQEVLKGNKIHVNHALPGAVVARAGACIGGEMVLACHHDQLHHQTRGDLEHPIKGTGDGRDTNKQRDLHLWAPSLQGGPGPLDDYVPP